ncbi:MAG: hypothetical protein ACPGYK_00065 [Flavobacteriales bacterium]
MKGLKLILMCAGLWPLVLHAQFSHLEVEEVDNQGLVPGKTYRIYAVMEQEGDIIDAIFGEEKAPMSITCNKPFWQHPKGGPLAADVQRYDTREDETLLYDSWVTIGAEDNYKNAVSEFPPNMNIFGPFETEGGGISSDNAAWFVTPDKQQAFAPADKRILLMQLTTEGKVEGVINIHGRTKAEFGDIIGKPTQVGAPPPREVLSGGELIQAEGVTFTCGGKK